MHGVLYKRVFYAKYRSKGEKVGPEVGAGGSKIKGHSSSSPEVCNLVGKVDQYKAILITSGQCNDDFWVTYKDNMSFPGQCPVRLDCNGELVVMIVHLQIGGVHD